MSGAEAPSAKKNPLQVYATLMHTIQRTVVDEHSCATYFLYILCSNFGATCFRWAHSTFLATN